MSAVSRWRVQAFGAEAAEPLAALHGRCFDEAWSAAAMAEFLATPGSVALLAASARQATPAGFALAREAAGEAELISLGVTPRWRRRGAGRALLGGVADWAKARAAAALFLEVGAENLAAQALYAGFGFAVVGRRPDYYRLADGRCQDALLMRCRLEIDVRI